MGRDQGRRAILAPPLLSAVLRCCRRSFFHSRAELSRAELSRASSLLSRARSANMTHALNTERAPRSEHPHHVVYRPCVAGCEQFRDLAERGAFGGEGEPRERFVDGEPFGALVLAGDEDG